MRRIFNDPKELEDRINEYYKYALENDKHITVTGLAWYLGTNRTTLRNYRNSKLLKDINDPVELDNIKNVLDNAISYIESEYEERLYNKATTVGTIFSLKNNFNWIDKQEIESNNNTTVKQDLSGLSTDDIKAMLSKF